MEARRNSRLHDGPLGLKSCRLYLHCTSISFATLHSREGNLTHGQNLFTGSHLSWPYPQPGMGKRNQTELKNILAAKVALGQLAHTGNAYPSCHTMKRLGDSIKFYFPLDRSQVSINIKFAGAHL